MAGIDPFGYIHRRALRDETLVISMNGFDLDVTSRKHQDNPNSAAAWDKIRPANAEECMRVLRLLRLAASLTGKEVAVLLAKEFHTVSGRLSQLKEAGYAVATKERRDGCGVVKITEAGVEALKAHRQEGRRVMSSSLATGCQYVEKTQKWNAAARRLEKVKVFCNRVQNVSSNFCARHEAIIADEAEAPKRRASKAAKTRKYREGQATILAHSPLAGYNPEWDKKYPTKWMEPGA